MFSKLMFLAAMLVVTQAERNYHCSDACGACCLPNGGRPDLEGFCRNADGDAQCHLATQACPMPDSAPLGFACYPSMSVHYLDPETSGPSSHTLAIGWMSENARIWGDVDESRFKKVPAFMDDMGLMIPSHRLSQDTLVEFRCTAGPNWEICDAYVLIYSCPPCLFEKGGLPAQLVSEGWEPTRCAPGFVSGVDGGITHRMMAFKKIVAEGDTASFTNTGGVVEFAAFGVNALGTDCSLLTQMQCEGDSHEGLCSWNSDSEACETNYCPANNLYQGPPVEQCSTCIRDELVDGHHEPHPPSTPPQPSCVPVFGDCSGGATCCDLTFACFGDVCLPNGA